jgi:hypothetical protein
VGLLSLAVLGAVSAAGCVRGSQPAKPGEGIAGVMRLAEKALAEGEAALSGGEAKALPRAAAKAATALAQTRDKYSPDPRFFALADEAAAVARRGAARAEAGDSEGAAQAWRELKARCEGCHARYGGPTAATQPATSVTLR